MGYARKGLRGLGLCFLVVLGLMALAAGAQGQSPGKFLDAGGELAVGTTFTGAQEGPGSLLIPNLGAPVGAAIECETADVEEGKVTAKLGTGPPHTPGTAHATIKFLNCIVRKGSLVIWQECQVEGKSVLPKVKLLAILASSAHANEPFVLAEPLTTGQPFATIKIINAPFKLCPITGTYPLEGSLALKVLAGLSNPQLVIPYANQALLGDAGLKLGVNPATLDVTATIEIASPEALKRAAFGVC